LPPCIDANVGDIAIIGETRKLSKTKAFVVLQVKKK
jgi:ribosomal protein S17